MDAAHCPHDGQHGHFETLRKGTSHHASCGPTLSTSRLPCHARGKNTVNPAKTLQKADLEKYDKYSEAAIITQVTYGNGAMPKFGGRLKPEQIENVAAYVLKQADEGWKSSGRRGRRRRG